MIRVENLGTLWAFILEMPEEIAWAKDHVGPEPWAEENRFLADHLVAGELALGMRAAGFDVGPCESYKVPKTTLPTQARCRTPIARGSPMVKADAADAAEVLYYFDFSRHMFPLDRIRMLCEFVNSQGLVSEFARFVSSYESRLNEAKDPNACIRSRSNDR